MSTCSNFQTFEFRKCKNPKFQKKTNGTTTAQTIQNFRLQDMKTIDFQGRSHHIPDFLKYVGDKYAVRGSRFGNMFGRSRNHPNSIAIDREALISQFGIIKTPWKP